MFEHLKCNLVLNPNTCDGGEPNQPPQAGPGPEGGQAGTGPRRPRPQDQQDQRQERLLGLKRHQNCGTTRIYCVNLAPISWKYIRLF